MNTLIRITRSTPYIAFALSFLTMFLINVFADEPIMIDGTDYRKHISITFLSLFSAMLFLGKYVQAKYDSGAEAEDGERAMKHKITVVLSFNDSKLYKRALRFLKKHLTSDTCAKWSVTAMSIEDEMTKLDLLENAINDNDLTLAKEILEMEDRE